MCEFSVCFLDDSVTVSISAACFKMLFHMCASAYLSNRLMVMFHCSWIGGRINRAVELSCETWEHIYVYHVCGPVCLFVYKLYMYVCPVVYKYIFCTECTKGLGLAKSTIRPALYFSLTSTSHSWLLPNPYRTSPHVCLKGRLLAWVTLHVRITWSVWYFPQWGFSAAEHW